MYFINPITGKAYKQFDLIHDKPDDASHSELSEQVLLACLKGALSFRVNFRINLIKSLNKRQEFFTAFVFKHIIIRRWIRTSNN